MSVSFGIAARQITPPPGLPLGGYAARNGVSQGTLDPLFCRASVLSDSSATVALVSLDLLYVVRRWSEPLRRRVAAKLRTKVANVLVAASHTHSGPALFGSSLSDSGALRAAEERVAEQVLEAVEAAWDRCTPVRVEMAQAAVAGIGSDRRHPGVARCGPLEVLVFRSASDDGLLGVIACFGCHPTVLDSGNLLYSADLFGAAAAEAERRLRCSVMLCNGAAADVSTRFTRVEQTPAEVLRLGAALADAMEQTIRDAAPIAAAPLRARTDVLPIHVRQYPSVQESERLLRAAADEFQIARTSDAGDGSIRLAASRLEGAMAQLFLAKSGGAEGLLGHTPDAALVQVLRIGAVDVVAAPGELFSNSAASIRAARPRPAVVIGYANDYLGYLVPSSSCGDGDYESMVALIDGESADSIIEHMARVAAD